MQLYREIAKVKFDFGQIAESIKSDPSKFGYILAGNALATH
jgi:hypothetical protein